MTKLAAGLESQRVAAAISSGWPTRPVGWLRRTSASVSGRLVARSSYTAVAMTPGQAALMRTPRAASSRATLLVRPMTPCLEAW